MRLRNIMKLLRNGEITPYDLAKIKKSQIYKIIETYRWKCNNGKPFCPRCGNCEKIYHIRTRGQYRCGDKECKYTFSLFSGTVFANHSFRGDDGFVKAFFMLAMFSSNISAKRLAETIGMSRRTAWRFLHKIRDSFNHQDQEIKLEGVVEMDGVYFYKNKHHKNKYHRRRSERVAIFARERSPFKGAIRTKVIATLSENSKDILNFALKHFNRGSEIQTDEHYSYAVLKPYFKHRSVKHSRGYVNQYGVNNNQCESINARAREIIDRQSRGVGKSYFLSYLFEVAYRADMCQYSKGEIIDDLLKKCLFLEISDDLIGYDQGNRRIGERLGA